MDEREFFYECEARAEASLLAIAYNCTYYYWQVSLLLWKCACRRPHGIEAVAMCVPAFIRHSK